MTQLYDYLKGNPMFSQLGIEGFTIVEHYLYFKALEPDEYLIHEGDKGDFVAFVALGKLAVLKNDPTGKPQLLTTITSGDCIGEMTLFDTQYRSASVKALEKTAIIILPKKDFERILKDHPRIGIELLKGVAMILSLSLRRTSSKLSQLMAEQH